MTTVTLEEAQAKLPELIEHLRPGEEMMITDDGKPLAQVKRADSSSKTRLRRAPGLGKGMITIVSDDDEHLKDFAEYMP
jgi:antitoxin (DNA-binding transcriptional repressor) of toxin-antitoxin stability system